MDGGGCGKDRSGDDRFDTNSDIDCDSCSDDDDPNATSVCNRNVDGDSGGLVASADANAEGSGDDENSVDSTSERLRKSSLVFKYFTDSDGLGPNRVIQPLIPVSVQDRIFATNENILSYTR